MCRNWCAFIVQKNVSCAVQGSVESYDEPEAAPCPQHQPDCEQQVIYRTRFRPTYKIAYKLVTELEWRCCPGNQGPDCRELKGSPNRQLVHPQSHQPLYPGQQRLAQRPERRETGPYDVRRADKTRVLEEEVQRLSQTVLHLQSSMTGLAENLRTDLQEDTSKMLITLLNDRNPPDSARAGGTEERVVHLDGHQATRGHTHSEREIDKLLARLNDMTEALKSKDEELEVLQGTVKGHDGQIRMLMDTSQGLPITDAAQLEVDMLQTYIDGKFEKLKKELVSNMEDQMTGLKKTCDDKIESFQKTCEEGKDSGCGSFADLLRNKEAELRKEIRELRLDRSVSDGVVRTNHQTTDLKDNSDYDDLRREINRVAEAHRVLNVRVDNELKHLSTLKIEDLFGTRIEDLEDRMNVTEKNAETYCFYVDEKLNTRITDEVAVLRQLLGENLNAVQDHFTGLLIEMNNNSPNGVDSVADLRTQVNSNNILIQGLEDKFNAIGQICTAGCPTGSTPIDFQKPDGVDSLVQDVGLLRKDLDFLSSKIVNNAAKLHALDTLTKMLPQKQFINTHIQETHNRLNTLTDNVNGVSGAVTGLGDIVSKFSQDLHVLNSKCCRSGGDSIPALQVGSEPGHIQIEELRDKVDKLNERVTTELSVCKLNTNGVAEGVSAVDQRVTALEEICGRLDGGTNYLQRFVGDLARQTIRLENTAFRQLIAINRIQNKMGTFVTNIHNNASSDGLRFSQNLFPSTRTLIRLPVRQERPMSVPKTRPPVQPNRPYIPHIHIPLVIPHRTVPVTARPPVRQPPVLHQPYFPQPPRQPSHPVQPDRLPAQKPVVFTGEAGPPGYVRRVTVRRDQTSEDTKTPMTRFAGAPGYPPVNPVSYNIRQPQPAAHIPWYPAHHRPIATPVSQQNSFMDPFSFSAGLTRQTFSGDFGIIRFDRVLVNDGGHYNPNTGIFTVPTDGRYLVTAVLTAPRGEHAEAALSVSNRSVHKLDTAGYWSGQPRQTRDQCMCGGSASFSLILPLRQGDTVALVRTAGKLAISESREILSTFSAIFLYAPQARR
ncbi:EMILIN-2 Elastin microfibril interface-located protein 2 [Triplophysa tibetana]|uniref:EMILIN-2 Elastin microfibril interface-located protein 2 n=1 Tax=Triplophysa tibetana TaxID=1572043 RepID=A0A5A9PE97_9TELE|nr:EMILIN-2 Elastin microfibril interface-located protein 2 [Triplophysa tibetana]